MNSEILLKDDRLRVFKSSKNKITFTQINFTCQLLIFFKYSPAKIAIFLKDSLLLKTFPLGFSQFLKQSFPVK